jgi:hypothetical protein
MGTTAILGEEGNLKQDRKKCSYGSDTTKLKTNRVNVSSAEREAESGIRSRCHWEQEAEARSLCNSSTLASVCLQGALAMCRILVQKFCSKYFSLRRMFREHARLQVKCTLMLSDKVRSYFRK